MLLHDQTQLYIDNFLRSPSHALMLRAPVGSGKMYVAKHITSKLLAIPADKLESHPYFKLLSPIKNVITIDQIRELQKFMQLKTTGSNQIRRVAIIEDAHLMNDESQNSLLKILEEPPADSVVLLTVQGEQSLKSTIYSRSQQIALQSPSLESVTSFYGTTGHSTAEIMKAYTLAKGSMGLIDAIVKDDQENGLLQSINEAKQILSDTAFGRLARVEPLSKNSELLPQLLYSLKRVSSAALEQAANKQDDGQVKKWHSRVRLIHKTEQTLKSRPNPKLMLTYLFVNL